MSVAGLRSLLGFGEGDRDKVGYHPDSERLFSELSSSGHNATRCHRSRFWIRVRSAIRSLRDQPALRISIARSSRNAAGKHSTPSLTTARATASESISSDLPVRIGALGRVTALLACTICDSSVGVGDKTAALVLAPSRALS